MSMDKRSLYDGLNDFESELEHLLENLTEMKASLQDVVEKNTTLELENQRLRDRLRELNQETLPKSEKGRQELSQSMKKDFMFVMIYMDHGAKMTNLVPFVWKSFIVKVVSNSRIDKIC